MNKEYVSPNLIRREFFAKYCASQDYMEYISMRHKAYNFFDMLHALGLLPNGEIYV